MTSIPSLGEPTLVRETSPAALDALIDGAYAIAAHLSAAPLPLLTLGVVSGAHGDDGDMHLAAGSACGSFWADEPTVMRHVRREWWQAFELGVQAGMFTLTPMFGKDAELAAKLVGLRPYGRRVRDGVHVLQVKLADDFALRAGADDDTKLRIVADLQRYQAEWRGAPTTMLQRTVAA